MRACPATRDRRGPGVVIDERREFCRQTFEDVWDPIVRDGATGIAAFDVEADGANPVREGTRAERTRRSITIMTILLMLLERSFTWSKPITRRAQSAAGPALSWRSWSCPNCP